MQAIVSVVGAAAFPAGIACVVLDGRDHVGAIMLARAGMVLLSMALFAVTVFRTSSGSVPEPVALGRPRNRIRSRSIEVLLTTELFTKS